MPKPARRMVLALPVRSQETPTRGAKFKVLVLKYAPPVRGVGEASVGSTATRPFCSVIGDTCSYRKPMVTCKFELTASAS